MKSFRQIIAIILVCILCFSSISAYAMTTTEKENTYSAAVSQLETYLESFGNSSAELAGVYSTFNELGGYEQSKFFGYYVSVLMKIADEEYDYERYVFLDILERNESFNAYLKEVLKDSSIGRVEELKAYAKGREYEHDGRISEAIDCYGECMDFYDASVRYFDLKQGANQQKYDEASAMVKQGDLAGAYFKFSEIIRFKDSKERMDSILYLLGYTPSSPTDKPITITVLNYEWVKVKDHWIQESLDFGNVSASAIEIGCQSSPTFDQNASIYSLSIRFNMDGLSRESDVYFYAAIQLPTDEIIRTKCIFFIGDKGENWLCLFDEDWDTIYDSYGYIPTGKYSLFFGINKQQAYEFPFEMIN